MGLIQDIEALFDKVKAGIEARGVGTDVSDLVNRAKEQGTQLLKDAGHDAEEDAQTAESDVHDATAAPSEDISTPVPDSTGDPAVPDPSAPTA